MMDNELPKDAETAVRKLVEECGPIGVVKVEQLNRALPDGEITAEDLEAIIHFLERNGLRLTE